MNKFASLMISASIIATPAVAGNLIAPVQEVIIAPAPAAPSWGGFYIGGTAGSASGTQDYVAPNFNFALIDDTLYGAFAGYNVQRGSFVFGGEIAVVAPSNGLSPFGFPNEDHSPLIDVKARAGYSFGSAMVYGFGGYSTSNFDNTIDGPKTLAGANYGVGVDIRVTDNLFVGLEYIARTITGPGNTITPAQTRTTNINAIQARVGWNF